MTIYKNVPENPVGLLGRFSGRFSGATKHPKRYSWTACSKRRFVFHFFKATFETSLRPSRTFQLMGLNCANGKRDSGTKLATGLPHEFQTEQTRAFAAERATKSFASDSWTKFTSSEICLSFAQTVNRSVCPYKWSTTRMSYCSAFPPEVYLRVK